MQCQLRSLVWQNNSKPTWLAPCKNCEKSTPSVLRPFDDVWRRTSPVRTASVVASGARVRSFAEIGPTEGRGDDELLQRGKERGKQRTFDALEVGNERRRSELDTKVRKRGNSGLGLERDTVRRVGREVGTRDRDCASEKGQLRCRQPFRRLGAHLPGDRRTP